MKGASAGESLRAAAQRLASSSDTPRLDAELLLGHALGMSRGALLAALSDLEAPAGFDALVDRRAAGEPLAYIIGSRDFWTIDLRVTPDVLIPRPDSETLLEAALDHFGERAPARILDLGTGSGALLLAALDQWPQATGLGVDISPNALAVAQANAQRLGMAERAKFRLGDWCAGIDGRFDLILANPPYVADDAPLGPGVREHEPHQALFAGADGLDAYRVISAELSELMAPCATAVLEIGFDQGDSAAALFRDAGLAVTLRRDLGGNDRCLLVTRP